MHLNYKSTTPLGTPPIFCGYVFNEITVVFFVVKLEILHRFGSKKLHTWKAFTIKDRINLR